MKAKSKYPVGYPIQYPVAVQKLNWNYGNRVILTGITLNVEKGKFYSIRP